MFRIALALLALSSSVAEAAIFDRDDRMAATLNPVGIVTGGENIYYGSGFLIDRCNVLTARHVAGNVLIAVGRRLVFRAGQSASRGTVIVAGPFQDNLSPSRSIGADWMLVRLDRCLGRKLGFLRVMSAVDAYAAERGAGDAGFPRDRPMRPGPTVDAECRVLWVGGGRMAHDCATIAGNSGGPILARQGDGWVAIGINVAGADRAQPRKFDIAETNFAVDISSILSNICAFLDGSSKTPECLALRKTKSIRLTSSVLATNEVLPNR